MHKIHIKSMKIDINMIIEKKMVCIVVCAVIVCVWVSIGEALGGGGAQRLMGQHADMFAGDINQFGNSAS